MPYTLPPLPYAFDALEPTIDAKTMEIHHGKHHQAYITNLNKALEAHPDLQALSVEDLLRQIDRVPESIRTAVRNNGGGHANHSLFWTIMSPKGGGKPSGALADAIQSTFGSFEDFQAKLKATAVGQFGSGWAWLVWKDGALAVVPSHDADTPIAHEDGANGSGFPLLVCDVWEHAYYLDHQNNRKGFLEAWFDSLANWDFAAKNFA